MTDRAGEGGVPYRVTPSPWARGIALFVGLFSLVNTVAGRGGDIWWIDLGFLPPWLATALSAAGAVLLVAYAVRPHLGATRRMLTAAALLAFAALRFDLNFFTRSICRSSAS